MGLDTKYTVCATCSPVRTSLLLNTEKIKPKSDLAKVTVYSIGSIVGTAIIKETIMNMSPVGMIISTIGAVVGLGSLYKLADTTIKMTARKIKDGQQNNTKVRHINRSQGTCIPYKTQDEWDKQIMLIDKILKGKGENYATKKCSGKSMETSS
jgi:hypothetical protein